MPIGVYKTLASIITFYILWNGKGYFKDDYDVSKKMAACRIFSTVSGFIVTVALNVIL